MQKHQRRADLEWEVDLIDVFVKKIDFMGVFLKKSIPCMKVACVEVVFLKDSYFFENKFLFEARFEQNGVDYVTSLFFEKGKN